MRVKVLYLGLIRHKTGKNGEEYDLEEDSSLANLLNRIAERYGNALKGIMGGEGESRLDPTFIVTINGSVVNPTQGDRLKLRNGDSLALMTLISGG
ncbi:MAG: MoaD/ThiS family protein [Candidatus Bathyarchaeia archaeon]